LFWVSRVIEQAMRIIALLIAGIGLASLAGCGANLAEAQLKHHPRGFMREVVNCESHYAAIGNTARCRQALRLNAKLFEGY
jgi:hypothetical protein